MCFIWCVMFATAVSAYSDIILSERVPLNGSLPAPSFIDERIVGGELADITEFPHQVSYTVDNTYFCGGSIISDRYIMTAAHCIRDADPRKIMLRAGSPSRRRGTRIDIDEVRTYPTYDEPPYDKDLGLLRTASPIRFNDRIRPIALPPRGRNLTRNSHITVAGWGRTRHTGSSVPDRLMSVRMPVLRRLYCYLAYPMLFTRHMFCSGNFFLGEKGACQGDSGGAAIQDRMAVGLASFSRGCGLPFSPTVFTNLASPQLRDFIERHAGV